jgi:hypothetical protein
MLCPLETGSQYSKRHLAILYAVRKSIAAFIFAYNGRVLGNQRHLDPRRHDIELNSGWGPSLKAFLSSVNLVSDDFSTTVHHQNL